MSTYRAIILATGETMTYASGPDGLPIQWQDPAVNPVSEHVLVPDVVAVDPASAPVELPKITKLAFDNRFTPAELTHILMASMDDPSLPLTDSRRVMAASLRVMMRKQEMATCIDFSQPDAGYFLQVLVGVGLLDSHRPAQILSPIVQDKEVWHG